MTIFNYKIINYKKFVASMALFAILISSVSFLIQKPSIADAAITDCTTTVGNLVQNCSFEDPIDPLPAPIKVSVLTGPNSWVLNDGYTGIDNWLVTTPGPNPNDNVGVGSAFPPALGNRMVDITGISEVIGGDGTINGERPESGIEQNVSGLVVGKTYRLKFYQGYRAGLSVASQVTVLLDGIVSLEGVNGFLVNGATPGVEVIGAARWKEQSLDFVATATTTTIRFENNIPFSAFPANFTISAIDNISLVEVTPPVLSFISPAPLTNVVGVFTASICSDEILATTPASATLQLSDINVTNGTASSLTGPTVSGLCPGGSLYTVQVTPVGEGPITVTIPTAAVTDVNGNTTTAPTTLSVTFGTPPSVVLSTPTMIVNAPFVVSACPSEPVIGFTSSDFMVSNGTTSLFTGPTASGTCAGGFIYTITVTPTLEGVPVTIQVPASSMTDIATNNNTVSNTLSITYDALPPTITPVTISSNNINPQFATTGDTITLVYTVDTVPTTNTVTIGTLPADTLNCLPAGGPAPIVCTATLLVGAVSPINGVVPFEIVVTAPGPVSQTTVSTSDGSSVTIDRTLPVVTITSPTNGSTIGMLFTLTGTCESGLPVVISGSNFTPNPTTVSCVAGTYSAPLTATGNPSVSVTQTDLAGNSAIPATGSYVLVSALPVVTIEGPLGVTATGPNTITGTCSEIGELVTITGTGFTPTGATTCLAGGVYSYPITINSNTNITASQTNGLGTSVASTTTRLPRSGSSGGCVPGSPCDTNNSNNSVNNIEQVNNESSTCPAFTQYLKQGMRDGQNGVSEVSKVQKFLNRNLGIVLSIDGIFGKRTRDAVKSFQSMHFAEVLAPWALSGPTGWWYQSTRGYANFIENCSEGIVQLDNSVKVQDGKILN